MNSLSSASQVASKLPSWLVKPILVSWANRAVGQSLSREHLERVAESFELVLDGASARAEQLLRAYRRQQVLAGAETVYAGLKTSTLTAQTGVRLNGGGGAELTLGTYCRIAGLEHIVAALSARRGVIIAPFHFASFAIWPGILGLIAALLGHRVHVVVNEEGQQTALLLRQNGHSVWDQVELLAGNQIQIGVAAGRALLRHDLLCLYAEVNTATWAGGAMAAVAEGQAEGVKGIPVTAFGGTIRFPGGIGVLAERLDVPVLPAHLVRERPFRLHGRIARPIPPGTRVEVTQQLASYFEKTLLAFPDQWHLWPFLPLMLQDGGQQLATDR